MSFDVNALDSAIDEALSTGELDVAVEEVAVEEAKVEEIVLEDVKPVEKSQEDIAREKGWKPKEEFDGEEWVDAREFNKRGELFTKISSQSKAIKDLNQKIDSLVKHNQTIEEKAMQRALDKLERERMDAVTYGDVDAFKKADAQLKEFEQKQLTKAPEPVTVPDYVQQFADANPWFEKDQEMTQYMLFATQNLVNSGKELKVAIAEANETVKKTFANKFVNEKKQEASPVMRNQAVEVKKKGLTLADLDDDQKAVWNVLKHSMSKEKFLSQLEL